MFFQELMHLSNFRHLFKPFLQKGNVLSKELIGTKLSDVKGGNFKNKKALKISVNLNFKLHTSTIIL